MNEKREMLPGQVEAHPLHSSQAEAKMTVSGYLNRSRDSAIKLEEQLDILCSLIQGHDGGLPDSDPSEDPIDPNRFLASSSGLSERLGFLVQKAEKMVIYFHELYGA